MKVIRKDTVLDQDLLDGIIKEREVLISIDHPFIVHMRYGFQTPERLFFVMDLVKGGELWTYAREQTRIPEAEVKLYIANIALGIGALHDKNIIHRDIKLPNILIDEDGYLVLSDFGVALQLTKDDEDDSKKGDLTGTLDYMAIEMLKGDKCGKPIDWWALGVITYELILGQMPFSH